MTVYWNTFLMLMARVLTIACAMLTSAMVGKHLGTNGYGEFVIAMTMSMTITQFAVLGMQSSNAWLSAQDAKNVPHLFANTVWISLGLGLSTGTATVLFFVAAQWVNPQSSLANVNLSHVWIATLMVPLRVFQLAAPPMLVGVNRISAYNLSQIVLSVANLIAISGIYFVGGESWDYLQASLTAWCGASLILASFFHPWSWNFWAFDWPMLRRGIGYGIRAHIACILGFLVLKANVFVLQHYRGEVEVGLYSLAAQVTDAILLLPTTFAIVKYPQLVRESERRFQLMIHGVLFTAGFMLLGCTLAAVLMHPFVSFVYEEEFLPSVQILWAMLPAAFIYSLVGAVSQYLTAAGFPRASLGIWVAALGVLLVSNVFLIPPYGSIGAALSLTITYSVVLGMQLVLVRSLEQKIHREAAAKTMANESVSEDSHPQSRAA